ncbi:MAG: DUF4097 domain-containing protein [Thermoanaerobaculales bacterium]|jgi:DUF4097 and DUF4098 domain-containing protein YvlB|nr:DUF4097 domain-containing protein [Thermoanaerobaculales bacterium]
MRNPVKTMSILVALAATAGLVRAERTVEQSWPLPAGGRVEISNIAGSVEVVGWSGDQVEISGRLGDGVKDLEVVPSGSRLVIEVEQERHSRRGGEADLTVRIPAAADLEVETVSADISVEGLAGEVGLESVSGRIEISGTPSGLEAASVSGDVVATSTAGRAELESVSGDVIVRSAAGRLEANVVSGDIQIDGGVLDAFAAESVSGSIVCAARPGPRGRFDLETMSGSIELVVGADIDAEFQIESYSGSIRSDLGPPPRRTDEYGPGTELHFAAGNGGARIVAESFSGSVRIRVD